MFRSSYSGRRVLITGHTGFKGAWLTTWLTRLGAEVTGFSLDVPTSPSAFELLGLEKRIHHVFGDIRDVAAVERVIAARRPEIVFHMAAQALVRPSFQDPAATFAVNAGGTVNVLEAVRRCGGVKALVCITSDKCYRNDEWLWGYRETDHLGGHDPYSASKACAEIAAHSYFQSFFTEATGLATVRAGNVIGGGDWAAERIVPDCARAWSAGRAVALRNPGATRPWQHVLEPLSGYLWLGAGLLEPARRARLTRQAFNFGPAADVLATVGDVAAELRRHWPGFNAAAAPQPEGAGREATLLKLCCDKALSLLEWKATLTFPETMRLTAQWYKAWYDGTEPDLYALTGRQIEEYETLARSRALAWTA